MSQSGQQHPKADNGGQRPSDAKKAEGKSSAGSGSTTAATESGKSAGAGGKKDAKK